MTVHHADQSVTVHHGDCLDVLRGLPDASVDAVVTDPPYGLGFMGKAWDDLPPGLPWAQECLRVLRPGGHLLAFGGTRTWHRLACAVEDAGFEIRDSIAWLYGSGFPKSLDVSKAIDKAAGATREKVQKPGAASAYSSNVGNDRPWMQLAREQGFIEVDGDAPATPAAQQWQGWGTALKPSHEPIVVARKPLAGTVAANVLAHGTGALNIDGCRVGTGDNLGRPASNAGDHGSLMVHDGSHGKESRADSMFRYSPETQTHAAGRWPANVVLTHTEHCQQAGTTTERVGGGANASGGFVDGYQRGDGWTGTEVTSPVWRCADGCPVGELDAQSGTLTSGANPTRRRSDKFRDAYGDFQGQEECVAHRGADTGGASRFFPTFRYQAKAPTRERVKVDGIAHPTVKPLALMRWLVRLVTPPDGTVLDPFAGSGTTVEAALLEGVRCIAVEREADYLPLIAARIARARETQQPPAAKPVARPEGNGRAAKPVARPEGNGRAGEPSADRRYTDRGGSDFAMKPGPRHDRPHRTPKPPPDLPPSLFDDDDEIGA